MNAHDLFRCPQCGAHLSEEAGGPLTCPNCRAIYPANEGIIDFVAGRATTKLDDIDYDQFYNITDNPSGLVGWMMKSAGDFWPNSFGTSIEIGAGTGGFTVAFLTNCAPARLVVTDVSPKMLRICRERLSRCGLLEKNNVLFATYGTTELCFSDDAFDTCMGTSVLHHITDVRSFLVDLARMLKNSGIAFFIEPNLRFHQALAATLADIVAYLLSTDAKPEDVDIARMCNWIAEIRCNILHRGDLEFLATREDKHMFIGDEIETLALEAGFKTADALVFGPDPLGETTLRVYLAQCEISKSRLEQVISLLPYYASRYMTLLAASDRSPSYLLWFSKSDDGRRRKSSSGQVPTSGPAIDADAARIRCRIDFDMLEADGHIELRASGWCAAIPDIRWLRVRIGDETAKFLPWLPRMDVHAMIKDPAVYHPLNSICCGIDGSAILAWKNGDSRVDFQASVIFTDGTEIPLTTQTTSEPGARITIAQ
jgi:2-polyprenyl-3-methyl-5-hydroxy-6-metoxy-1,4-benzoquinol methylase